MENIMESALDVNRDKKRDKLLKSYKRKHFFLKWVISCFIFFLIPNFWGLLLSVAWMLVYTIFLDHSIIYLFKPDIRIWFGIPGSGKTSMSALLTRMSTKLSYKVLTNVEIKGAYKLDSSDLGVYDMSFDGDGAHVIIDEASLVFDNRNHREFAKSDAPKYFALHRHMNNRVDVFSQGYDIDKRIRDRASSSGLFHLRKTIFTGFVSYRRISKVLFIRKEDKQLIDGFKFVGLPRLIYSRSVWDSFDTLDMSMCPKAKKQWTKW